MRRRRLGALVAGALLAGAVHADSASVTVLERFDPDAGEFAENIALAPDGTLYVSLTDSGAIHRRDPDGGASRLAPEIGPDASLTGLALGPSGELIVGVDRRGGDAAKGVWAIDPDSGEARRLATLPDSAMVNGVAVDPAGTVYVADSAGGIVWQIPPGGDAAERWADGPMLAAAPLVIDAPDGELTLDIGVNGLAVRGNTTLYASVTGQASLVMIPIGEDGEAASAPVTIIDDLYVVGFVLDDDGGLIAAASHTGPLADAVVAVDVNGVIETLAAGLAQPSALAIGADGRTVYGSILGAFSDPPSPSLVRLEPARTAAPDR